MKFRRKTRGEYEVSLNLRGKDAFGKSKALNSETNDLKLKFMTECVDF